METNPDDILPPDPIPPDPEDEEEEVEQVPRQPDQLLRDGRIPIDHTTGEEYQPGEVPPGWSEPVP